MAAPLRRALLALGPARSRLPVSLPLPARPYRADPLRRRPGPAPADPDDLQAAARRFGRLGEASGVAVWRLWPSPEQLREAEAEEREWDPALRDVEAELDRREREEARRRKEREELQARSLAAMPARVAAWRREREAARERRRRRLLAEAGLGGLPRAGTPARAPGRAQEVLEELERRQRREEKRRRRQQREDARREDPPP
ncbi:PREDICTED: growth arrest and DNA damage-inducible proteins-interacting protein 1 [Pseudopodoces humilis]|uniref:growth arrest and DNA damage-inducible proteins-interacting protein 1 n=1 Tax=Pseudopodoces humilis TaxID=181119 RepID=UPI0006B7D062|nr:PREDICTED: growth arrest and DNA damage-inducible proteins-interacting protein 1 [Pseudopodoces humilis]